MLLHFPLNHPFIVHFLGCQPTCVGDSLLYKKEIFVITHWSVSWSFMTTSWHHFSSTDMEGINDSLLSASLPYSCQKPPPNTSQHYTLPSTEVRQCILLYHWQSCGIVSFLIGVLNDFITYWVGMICKQTCYYYCLTQSIFMLTILSCT